LLEKYLVMGSTARALNSKLTVKHVLLGIGGKKTGSG
jgi:hypothetical protein